jgi:hypothetical protein
MSPVSQPVAVSGGDQVAFFRPDAAVVLGGTASVMILRTTVPNCLGSEPELWGMP